MTFSKLEKILGGISLVTAAATIAYLNGNGSTVVEKSIDGYAFTGLLTSLAASAGFGLSTLYRTLKEDYDPAGEKK